MELVILAKPSYYSVLQLLFRMSQEAGGRYTGKAVISDRKMTCLKDRGGRKESQHAFSQ
jgi:hypothetical protein